MSDETTETLESVLSQIEAMDYAIVLRTGRRNNTVLGYRKPWNVSTNAIETAGATPLIALVAFRDVVAVASPPPAAPGLDDDPFGYRPIPGQPSPRIDRAFSCCGSNDPDCPGDHPECHPDGVIAAPELDAFASRMDIEVAISRLDSAMDELWGIIDPDYVATEADDFSLPEMSFLATTALAEAVAQFRASQASGATEGDANELQ